MRIKNINELKIKEIQKKMEKNVLPTKKDMIKHISDIIKFKNF